MAINMELVGKPTEVLKHSYDWRDTVLYALGVGATTESELDYLFEMKGPKVLPTFACVPSFSALMSIVAKLGADFTKILHGEQTVILHRPIPDKGEFQTQAVVEGIYDKGKGALVVVKAETSDKSGEKVFDNIFSIFVRGEGGFGGDRGPENKTPAAPDRAPDFEVSQVTTADQAALYRLCGDYNPLHISPELAKAVGFEKPILHGLCTYGFAGRAFLHNVCDSDPAKFKSFSARFKGVVLPGDTLVTKGWQVEPDTYVIETSKPDGSIVLGNAVAKTNN